MCCSLLFQVWLLMHSCLPVMVRLLCLKRVALTPEQHVCRSVFVWFCMPNHRPGLADGIVRICVRCNPSAEDEAVGVCHIHCCRRSQAPAASKRTPAPSQSITHRTQEKWQWQRVTKGRQLTEAQPKAQPDTRQKVACTLRSTQVLHRHRR